MRETKQTAFISESSRHRMAYNKFAIDSVRKTFGISLISGVFL
jgi:hypothetical protein